MAPPDAVDTGRATVEHGAILNRISLAQLHENEAGPLALDQDEGSPVFDELLSVEANRKAFQQNADSSPEVNLNALSKASEAWWTTGTHLIPQRLIETVDENVRNLMPVGTAIISIHPYGTSTWSRTAKIQTKIEGQEISYFVKATDSISGQIMYRSEFESLKAIHEAVSGFCPRPLGWGKYASDPNVHFLLSAFTEMRDEPADPILLPRRLAQLHQKAVAPDGRHGWHVPLAGGQLPVRLAKSVSWEDFFGRYMRFFFRAEEIAQGPRPPAMDRLVDVLFDRVIPRLLRPLETGGREIVPRLLHTDLWDGNAAVDDDGLPVMFDPCSMYGHNEFDIGVWTNPRMVTGLPFINSYHNFFERSAPEEDHYGRNILYSLAFETRVSATIVGNSLFRDELIRYMTDLDEMYPESYEEWARSRGEEVCPPKSNAG